MLRKLDELTQVAKCSRFIAANEQFRNLRSGETIAQ